MDPTVGMDNNPQRGGAASWAVLAFITLACGAVGFVAGLLVR